MRDCGWTTRRGSGARTTRWPGLARYSIRKTHGGVYVDVDIAPGKVALSDTTVRSPSITLLAPEIRDARAVREEYNLSPQDAITEKMVQDLAAKQLAGGYDNNNFIRSSAGSVAIEAVIRQVAEELRKKGGGRFVLENAVATAAITGPVAVKRALHAYLREEFPNLDEFEAMDVLNKALERVPALEWITPESEAQEH